MHLRPRGLRRAAGALCLGAALGVVPGACAEEARPEELALRDWPGRDGAPVALDQVLRFEFSAPLAAPVRASTFSLREEGADETRPVARWEAAGSYLSVMPRLPRRPDLTDGTLRPGRRYRVSFRGVPSLGGLVSSQGRALVGDREVRFATPAADAPGLFSGEGMRAGPVSLEGLRADGVLHVPPGEPARLRFRAGLDPRTLTEPARLAEVPGDPGRACPLSLARNEVAVAELTVDLGDWSGWGVLTLPASLRGLDGSAVLPAHRQLRLHRAP